MKNNPCINIPVSRPAVGKEELLKVKEVFATGWLGMGSVVFKFEEELKKILNTKYVIAVNTGTSALHISLDSLGLKPQDEVIVPSLTFVASLQAIVQCRARPVFCDVYEDTLNMDVEDASRKVTKKTRVIMPVHYSGLPCMMHEIIAIAKNKGITIVEDAAHAFGSYYDGKKIGSIGDITCFSFDPIKNITCGEGGAVSTNNKVIADKIINKRVLGINKDTWHRYKNRRTWQYEVNMSGFRYHMSNINAAIGLEQLKKMDKFIERKRKIVRQYDEAFKNIGGLEPVRRDYETTAPFNYIIKVKNGRDRLMEFLKTFGIETGIHYIPNHLQPFFAKYKVKLPATEKVFKEMLTLPLYYDMSETDVLFVIEKVKTFFKK